MRPRPVLLRAGLVLATGLLLATCDSGGGAGGAGASCSTDKDCQTGLLCVVGLCTPTSTSCTSDAQCPGGACVAGSCTGLGGCTTDQDCPEGMICGADWKCTSEVTPDCTVDVECDDGDPNTTDACVAGSCSNTPVNIGCLTDDDCLDGDPCTGDTCNGGSCYYEDVPDCCTTDAQCDDGSEFTDDSCVENACQYAPVEVPCETDAECDDQDFCTFDSCTDGLCVNTASADPFCCNSADDCDDGDDTTVDLCEENSCTWTNCTSDIDCEDNNPCSEQACQEGVCIYTILTTPACACVSDVDCMGKGGACALVQLGPTSVATYCVNSQGPKMGGVDCATNEECFTGLCMGLSSGENYCFQGCVSDTECTMGTMCSTVVYGQGTPDEKEIPACLPAPTGCSGDGACPEGEICRPTENPDWPGTITTVCAPPGTGTKGPGQICGDDGDCQSDICLGIIGTEQSVCWSACASDLDCSPGLKCYVNLLYFVFDQDTPMDLSDDTRYSIGSCMPDIGTYNQCAGDTDCAAGEFCYPGNNQTSTQLEPRCLDSWSPGSTGAGDNCTTDDQCLSGMCISAPSGFCLGLCSSDFGCFGATSCQTYDSFVVDDKGTPNDETDDVLDALDLCLP